MTPLVIAFTVLQGSLTTFLNVHSLHGRNMIHKSKKFVIYLFHMEQCIHAQLFARKKISFLIEFN